MKEIKRPEKSRFTFVLFFMIGVVFIIQVVIVVILLQKQKYDGVRINLSGRQRMLTQKLTKELVLYSEHRITAREIERTIRVFDLTMRGLYGGGGVPEDLDLKRFRYIPGAGSESVKTSLHEIMNEWETFKINTYSYILNRDSGSFDYVINRNIDLLEKVDESVAMLEKNYEQRNSTLTATITSAVLLIVLVLSGMLAARIREVHAAKSQIIELEKMLPICANCKRIRKEDGDPYDQRSWVKLEEFLKKERDITFSHGLCPECAEKLYPGILKEK